MQYGDYLKELIEASEITKTDFCAHIGISRPYLYAIFTGRTPPPVPEKQRQIVSMLGLTAEQESILFDLAASERNETPADIAACIENPSVRAKIRKDYIYHELQGQPYHMKPLKRPIRVPCSYQGGKQRVAREIVESILNSDIHIDSNTVFYDLCCGSGGYTVELINQGISPRSIVMLDKSSWGSFWEAIGSGRFDLDLFADALAKIPNDKRSIRDYMTALSKEPLNCDECYRYIILQACSFGGKQIWHDGEEWRNAFFRSYWEPTPTSIRRSPANPMQPSPKTLWSRVRAIASACNGITCYRQDVTSILKQDIPDNSVIYLDPPYRGTTGYAYTFDVDGFISKLKNKTKAPLFVSEGIPLSNDSIRLNFGGANGGISGHRSSKHQEWLSRID